MLRPQFARDQIADLDSLEFHAKHFFMHFPTGKDGWTETLNMQPLLSRMVLDAATEFLCGESVFAQVLALPDTPENRVFKASFRQGALDWTRFADCFDQATKTLGVRIRMFERCKLLLVIHIQIEPCSQNRLPIFTPSILQAVQGGASVHGSLCVQGPCFQRYPGW